MEKQVKARQLLLNVASFIPLIFFQVWTSSYHAPGSMVIAAFAMLAYCILIIVTSYRWDKPGYFDWATTGYFTAICGSLLLWPDGATMLLRHYGVTGIYLCLFAVASCPPLFGMDPFTYHYAKKTAPPDIWKNPLFVKINRIMTFTWAGIFALCTILTFYPSFLMQIVLPNVLVLGFGFPFNSLFPDFYLKRLGIPSRSEWRRTAQENAGEGPAVYREVQAPSIHRESNNTDQHFTAGKEKTMKVLAMNSSPRSEGESKTELMLNSLVKGMREAGVDVEVVNLRKKKVNNCIGCFTCWTKTPGFCLHKDDMTSELFPKWAESDLVIYATPLYHFTVNAAMKAFIERTLPGLEPFFEDHKGRTVHPLRFRHPSVVMLSVAGFPEDSAFDQLSSWANFVFRDSLVAEIYRAGAEVMTVPFCEEKTKDILEAVTQAGRELVKNMKVDPATMARIKQPISGDTAFLHEMGNLMWKTCIAEGLTPREFAEEGLAPRPYSIETFMAIMPMGVNPRAAGGIKAVIQFDFSGDIEGSCHFKIEDNKIAAFPRAADKSDLTIKTPFSLWMDIMNGKADGQKMFMEQKFKVLGDISILMRMNQIFRK